MTPELGIGELLALAGERRLSSLFGAARGVPAILVGLEDLDGLVGESPAGLGAWTTGPGPDPDGELGLLPVVLVGVTDDPAGAADGPAVAERARGAAAGPAGLVDLVVGRHEAERFAGAVADHPLAAVALALLLRHGGQRSVTAGLVAESSTYSMLQAGPEFAAWRTARGRSARHPGAAPPGPPVRIDDDGVRLAVTLHRPHRHNAVDTALAEGLVEALTQALALPGRRIELRGAGPSFCSGGDLAEFGSFPDPATAHAARLARSAGHLVWLLRDRIEVHVHGACLGAGIELPAFAGTVVAAPDASIGLPELSLGLVPGAGGTVSLPRRIGRHRTMRLALGGERIGPATALAWGLVDRLAPG